MLSAHSEAVEGALWSALRILEERSALMKKLAVFARRRGHPTVADMYELRMDEVETDVKALHDLVTTGDSLEPIGQDPA